MYHINDDPRSIYSKNMLYRALAEKLQEQAFPTITIKEVVQRAQVGRSTFYRNFDQLEDILLWKCDETFEELSQFIFQIVSDRENQSNHSKFPFLYPFFSYWYKNSEIIELLIAANRIDMIFTAFERALDKFMQRIVPNMMNQSPHYEYFLAFRAGAIIRILLTWIKNNKDLSPAELCEFIEAQSEGL